MGLGMGFYACRTRGKSLFFLIRGKGQEEKETRLAAAYLVPQSQERTTRHFSEKVV